MSVIFFGLLEMDIFIFISFLSLPWTNINPEFFFVVSFWVPKKVGSFFLVFWLNIFFLVYSGPFKYSGMTLFFFPHIYPKLLFIFVFTLLYLDHNHHILTCIFLMLLCRFAVVYTFHFVFIFDF